MEIFVLGQRSCKVAAALGFDVSMMNLHQFVDVVLGRRKGRPRSTFSLDHHSEIANFDAALQSQVWHHPRAAIVHVERMLRHQSQQRFAHGSYTYPKLVRHLACNELLAWFEAASH